MRKVSLVSTSIFMLSTILVVAGCEPGGGQNNRRASIKRSPKTGDANNPEAKAREDALLTKNGAVGVVITDKSADTPSASIKAKYESALQGQVIEREALPAGTFKLKSASLMIVRKNGEERLMQSFAVNLVDGKAPEVSATKEERTKNLESLDLLEQISINIPIVFAVKDGMLATHSVMTVRNRINSVAKAKDAVKDIWLDGTPDKDRDFFLAQLANAKIDKKHSGYAGKLTSSASSSGFVKLLSSTTGIVIAYEEVLKDRSHHYVLTYERVSEAPADTAKVAEAQKQAVEASELEATKKAADQKKAEDLKKTEQQPKPATTSVDTTVASEAVATEAKLPTPATAAEPEVRVLPPSP